MKRSVENWSIERLHKARTQVSFPEYQRQAKLWSLEKKQLLIDSILRDIDIPKLYFNRARGGELEVVDGQQRLWSIWEFIDDTYHCQTAGGWHKFSDLPTVQRKAITGYTLQVTIVEDADDEYLRELFLRLQLGLLLVTGEKLHAATGAMKDLVFDKMATHRFILAVRIPNRRYAKETLCAQIAINSYSRAKLQAFARTRYEDLVAFFREYERPSGTDKDFFVQQSKNVISVLDSLGECFGEKAKGMTNRSYILSVYLLFEELGNSLDSAEGRQEFVRFVVSLWKRLKEEVRAGFERKNRELYVFETMLSSAPGERYQIERRHQTLVEYYEHFKRVGKIKGDK